MRFAFKFWSVTVGAARSAVPRRTYKSTIYNSEVDLAMMNCLT